MTQKNKYQAYATATQTVAKTKQIVMLYDGIMRFVQRAKEAIGERRIEDRYKMLAKASEVLTGLQGCLDFEKGGEIAKILYNFYSNIDAKIFSVHRTNSIAMCDEVLADLRSMRDVWQGIDNGTVTEDSSAASSAPAGNASIANNASEKNIILSA